MHVCVHPHTRVCQLRVLQAAHMLRKWNKATIPGWTAGSFWKLGTTVSWSMRGRHLALQHDIGFLRPLEFVQGPPMSKTPPLGFQQAPAGQSSPPPGRECVNWERGSLWQLTTEV